MNLVQKIKDIYKIEVVKQNSQETNRLIFKSLWFDGEMLEKPSDKDLKIQNNTDAPIYIESKTEDGMLTFFIYGKAKQKGREVRLETVILETIEPGEDVIVQNHKLQKTDFVVVQIAHKGYKAELYKIVYQNGREIERVKLNISNYVASPKYIETGMSISNSMD